MWFVLIMLAFRNRSRKNGRFKPSLTYMSQKNQKFGKEITFQSSLWHIPAAPTPQGTEARKSLKLRS